MLRTAFKIASSSTTPVPNVSMRCLWLGDADGVREHEFAACGEARPRRCSSPPARRVAPERSTFVGSLPLKAPPPAGPLRHNYRR